MCGDHHNVRADDDSVPRRLAVAGTVFSFHRSPRAVWFILKVCLVFFLIAMVKAFVPRYTATSRTMTAPPGFRGRIVHEVLVAPGGFCW